MDNVDYTKITDGVTQQINDSFGGIFAGLAAGSILVTVIILVFWIINSVRKWKMQKAIFEIQKDIREMNERQKGTSLKP